MRFLGNLTVQLLEMIELCRQGGLLLGVLVVDILDLGAELVDLLTEGFQQRIQRLLTGLGKGLPLGFEDLARQLFELHLQLLTAVLEQLLLLGKVLLALLEGAFEGRVTNLEVFILTLHCIQTALQTLTLAAQLIQLTPLLCPQRLCALGLKLPVLLLGLLFAEP